MDRFPKRFGKLTVRLKELSDLLGLSPTTVSRALNGYPEVAEATRARVHKAAAENNYSANTRAQGLATGRAMAVGHVIPLSARHEIVNPVFSDFVAGAAEIYQRHGFDMVLSVVADAEEDRIYRQLRTRGTVDGVIVHGPRLDDARIGLLRDIGLPFVVHGRVPGPEDGYDWVDVNNRRAFQRATQFLLDLGHRRIALINGLAALDFADRRARGFADALRARGLDPDPVLVRSEEMTENHGFAAAREMLDMADPPTAFLCSSMITALGVRRALDDRGLRMGRDVSIVTHDDELSYLKNADPEPIFTATRSSVRLAGRLCAERLIALLRQPDQPARAQLLDAELTLGRSTGPAPKGSES